MNNFIYHNPTKLVFGKGQIARLGKLIPAGTGMSRYRDIKVKYLEDVSADEVSVTEASEE